MCYLLSMCSSLFSILITRFLLSSTWLRVLFRNWVSFCKTLLVIHTPWYKMAWEEIIKIISIKIFMYVLYNYIYVCIDMCSILWILYDTHSNTVLYVLLLSFYMFYSWRICVLKGLGEYSTVRQLIRKSLSFFKHSFVQWQSLYH